MVPRLCQRIRHVNLHINYTSLAIKGCNFFPFKSYLIMTSNQFQFTSQILEKETISNDVSNSSRFYYLKPSNQVENHHGFLERLNSQKSVSNILPHFSCLLDEGIPKIWNKLNSHNGFLSYLQNSTANSAHLAAHFCPAQHAEAGCYYKKKVRWKTLQIQKI